MKCMIFVKASKDSEKGTMPGPELLAAMGLYNEELFKPPPPFMMPALRSSSLYFPIAAINSGPGIAPFSLSVLALTNIMHFMFISPFDLSDVVD